VNDGELILYTAEDGRASVQLRAEDGTVWLTQLEIAALFDTSKQNISLHIKNILEEGELLEGATVKESLTVQTEGGRRVRRALECYETFNAGRREAARLVADAKDMAALERTERRLEGKGPGKR